LSSSAGVSPTPDGSRERFSSRLALVATMIGVAVGLGNVWRFPYMVGRFGGASFVLFYVLTVALLGLPALMAEWSLGRHARRGPVGAFERAGFPGGRALGWLLFFVVTAATAYYTNVIGWVLFEALSELLRGLGRPWDAEILPPDSGFDGARFGLQMAATAVVILACAGVLLRGLRAGIERASKVLMPLLGVTLVALIARGLTLPGAWAGLEWYVLKFDPAALTDAGVILAAVGQAIFSLSLGGTFMVVYGSYLDDAEELRSSAAWTAAGDLGAGLLAGLAIFPAVFAFGLEPKSGPGLVFSTLPRVFVEMPAGWLFGLLFFVGLAGAAFLSDVGAFEVLVAGLTDATSLTRRQAVWTLAAVVFVFALPPMVNMEVFQPWDLTFGSGMQTLGALLAVVAFAWSLDRSAALAQLASGRRGAAWEVRLLYLWLRYVIPVVMVVLGVWWLATEVLGVAG
jgi:NSS family neurotransmitter:Na+ symporter